MPARKPRGTRLHHDIHGAEGDWLTLIHGGLVNSGTWKRQIPDLEPYCRVLTYDLRGYGRSDKPQRGYAVPEHAQDLLALWDELEIGESFVLGFSVGGFIAQEVALAAPERVTSLILVSTAGRLEQAARAAFRERAATVEQGAFDEEVDTHIRRAFSPEFLDSQPEVVSKYASEIAQNDPHVLAETLAAVASFDRLEDLGQIRCPTLILAGEHDQGMHPGYARELTERLPSSTLTVVPRVGHTMHVEAPTTFNHLVADFITSDSRERSAV